MLRPARVTDRIALAVVAVATAWFACTALWGLFGIPAAGHLGAGNAGNALAAEQMIRWHIAYPAWDWYTGSPPARDQYICHHPFGQYYVAALLLWVFGHHDFVVRLGGVLASVPVPLLLYGIAKERWGAPAGAVAAASYVVLPLAVGFSQFSNLETYVIAGALLFFWGHTRHVATGRARYAAASLAGLALACAGDWAGYLVVAPALVWSFVRAFALPARLSPRLRFAPYARWWAAAVAIAAGTLVLWLGLFTVAGQIEAWLKTSLSREGAPGLTLAQVLDLRRDWIDFSFTPLVVALGKAAAPVCVVRLLWVRADEEAYALSFLAGATVQYVSFEQGADIHIYWPFYFAPYYALAMAQLAHAIGAAVGLVGRLLRTTPTTAATAVAGVVLFTGLAPALEVAPDGVRSLGIWRRTGGRYDDKGTLTRSQLDLLDVVEQIVVPATRRGMPIDASPSADWYWEHTWLYQGPAHRAPLPASGDVTAPSHPFWIGRGSGLMADAQQKVAALGHLRVYGDTWLVDQRQAIAPADVYAVHEEEPGLVRWLLVEGTEPVRSFGAGPDPWLTWELRAHLGQPAELPSSEPRTLDEMRIAHNLAVTRGDEAGRARWQDAVLAKLDRAMAVRYEPGLALLGVRRVDGVQPRLEVWLEATAKLPGDYVYAVSSKVETPARFSLVPVPITERRMSWPPSIATRAWLPGFYYSIQVPLNHRIGRERYTGRWMSRDGSPPPARTDGGLDATLAIVE